MSEQEPTKLTSQLLKAVRLSDNSPFDRYFISTLIVLAMIYTIAQVVNGDWVLVLVSILGLILFIVFAVFKPIQQMILRKPFDRNHATTLSLLWMYGQVWIALLRSWLSAPIVGKDSQTFYVYLLLFLAITFRAILTAFALSPVGYTFTIYRIPLWEKILVAINEFIAAGLLAYIGGNLLATITQPQVFTVRIDPLYMGALLFVVSLFYVIMQVMWTQAGNDWLGKRVVWVRLARLFAPFALIVVTMVITRNFSRLSDSRTANLLGTADFNQAILALSPVIWMMIFFVFILVYSGGRGLRQRFLPDRLLGYLPTTLSRYLSAISDMDLLLLAGFFFTYIPLHLAVFDDEAIGVIDILRLQIAQQNAIIDSSEQALALIFALPFYVLAVILLVLYAYVIANSKVSAKERNELVERLPVGLLIIFIITLYLCAVPFSQVLVDGKLPQLPQELGRVLAFDIFIPVVLLYIHYFLLIRLPYGRGQSRWREQEALRLERSLERTDHSIRALEGDILRIERTWGVNVAVEARLNTLYQYVELNGKRDQLNMERLQIVNARQQLAEVSETPVSVAVARLPLRIVSIGIPLLIVFKVYEWAVLNDGLREIANNPNIGVIEFFQIVLQQLQF